MVGVCRQVMPRRNRERGQYKLRVVGEAAPLKSIRASAGRQLLQAVKLLQRRAKLLWLWRRLKAVLLRGGRRVLRQVGAGKRVQVQARQPVGRGGGGSGAARWPIGVSLHALRVCSPAAQGTGGRAQQQGQQGSGAARGERRARETACHSLQPPSSSPGRVGVVQRVEPAQAGAAAGVRGALVVAGAQRGQLWGGRA